jgi:uncharacterized membrane protein
LVLVGRGPLRLVHLVRFVRTGLRLYLGDRIFWGQLSNLIVMGFASLAILAFLRWGTWEP